ncbi:IS3 family transposase [Streptomyces sp. NPDC058653]|uniref:IS3 family transposase n=1 Tax=Streptomyces sp. NPDC058653 TaxID=3346576 RepID=UPI0036494D3D
MENPAARAVRDAGTKARIQEIHTTNYRVYGARKIWRELYRQGHEVARCTVERLRIVGWSAATNKETRLSWTRWRWPCGSAAGMNSPIGGVS